MCAGALLCGKKKDRSIHAAGLTSFDRGDRYRSHRTHGIVAGGTVNAALVFEIEIFMVTTSCHRPAVRFVILFPGRWQNTNSLHP